MSQLLVLSVSGHFSDETGDETKQIKKIVGKQVSSLGHLRGSLAGWDVHGNGSALQKEEFEIAYRC